METFTAANVKDSRLTLKPKSSGGLFKQAKSSVTVAVRGDGNKDKDSSARLRKKHESTNVKQAKDQKKAPLTEKRDTSSKYKHRLPSRSLDQTNTSSASGSDCESKVDTTTRGKSPGSVNSVPNPGVNEAYSDSWGVGSQLPSDTSSIRLPTAKSKDGPGNTASVDIPEPAIMTMATQWNFDGAQGAFGIFEVAASQPALLDSDRSEIPNKIVPAVAETRSRYFSAHNSPPHATSGNTHQDPTSPQLRHAIPLHKATDSLPEYEDTPEGNMNDFGLESPDPLIFREYSPVNSLDCMLAAHDEDEALYYMPKESQFQDSHQTGEEYVDDAMMEEYAAEETMLGADEEETGLFYDENYEVSFEVAEWHPLDNPDFGQQEEYDNMTIGLGDVSTEDGPVDVYEFFEQEGYHEDGDTGQEVDLQPYNEPDILPVAKGRLLLMGVQEPDAEIRCSSHSVNGTHPPTYGQSVQDIEIAFGSQIGHHW